MSNPSNILASYRSYAYHHILVVCDSTQTATTLSASDEIALFEHPLHAQRYTPRPVDAGEGKYVVLINGMSDATYSIASAKWETVIAPAATTTDGMSLSTTIGLDGELEIIEPNGANFLNTLAEVSDSLSSDPMGLVFMLKTVFVGFNDSGNVQEMITTVRPLLFSMIDISAIFDQSGSRYMIALVGIANGAAKTAPVTSIAGGKGIGLKVGDTLKTVFSNLEDILNSSYQKYLEDTQKKLDKSGIGVKLEDDYRTVEYKIKLDEQFNNFIAGDNEPTQTVNKRPGEPILQWNNSMGVEEVIEKIMLSSQAVVKLRPKYIYKISSSLDSTPTKIYVTYHIHMYEMKTMKIAPDAENAPPEPGKSIEFDYLFTGHNIDIKTFDIKMEMGMAFFQTIATASNLPTQKSATEGSESGLSSSGGGSQKATAPNPKKRSKTPLFFGTNVTDTLNRNTRSPEDTMGFQAMLNRHAAVENIQASMTIHGNPQLMDEMLIKPNELQSGKTETPKQDQTVNPTWLSVPTMAKINIRMPVDANNPGAGYKPFWYEGYYSLFSVNNIFDNGEFSQILNMFSLPVEDPTSTLGQTETKDEETTQKRTPARQAPKTIPDASTFLVANQTKSEAALREEAAAQAEKVDGAEKTAADKASGARSKSLRGRNK